MDAVVEPDQKTDPELHLLTDWGAAGARSRWREAAIGSVAAHVVAIVVLALLPESAFQPSKRPEIVARRQVTPLIAPRWELTQPTPNKGKVSKTIPMDSLLEQAKLQQPRTAPPSTTRPAAPTQGQPAPFTPPPTPAPAPTPQIAEPPKLDASLTAGALTKGPIGTPEAPPAPPQIQAEEKPKLQFETPGAPPSGPRPGTGKFPLPSASVAEAVRTMAPGGSGGVTVGDTGSGVGGLGSGMNLPPSAGKRASALELLSDPQGVDFRPYMAKVLAAVRRNWFAIMPESVKLGTRGKVILQFSIDRSGGVPKLVIDIPSGVRALDQAAVAGVSASLPFPSLPSEFRGDVIRLRLVFAYNTPIN